MPTTTPTRRARTLSPQAYALWELLSATRNKLGFAGVPASRCERVIAKAAEREGEEVVPLHSLVTELQVRGLVHFEALVDGVLAVWVVDPARIAEVRG